jgi:hypothetical protein
MLSVSLNCLFLIDPSVFSNVYLLSTVCRVSCVPNVASFSGLSILLNPPKIGSQPRCFIYNEANVTLLCCQPSFCTKWNNPEIYLIDYTLKDLNVLVSKCWVSLNCLFLIDPSVFSNVYLLSTVCRVSCVPNVASFSGLSILFSLTFIY